MITKPRGLAKRPAIKRKFPLQVALRRNAIEAKIIGPQNLSDCPAGADKTSTTPNTSADAEITSIRTFIPTRTIFMF